MDERTGCPVCYETEIGEPFPEDRDVSPCEEHERELWEKDQDELWEMYRAEWGPPRKPYRGTI